MTGARVSHVRGRHGVAAIDVIDADGRTVKIECDALAVSGGWNPAVHLTCHLGGKPVWNEALAAFVPGARAGGHACRGRRERRDDARRLSLRRRRGRRAWRRSSAGYPIASLAVPRAEDEPAAVTPLWHVKESRAKAFVDFQNDVTVKDIALANQEGFRSVEHLKRYTTLGMATDQGKVANVTGLAILAEVSGRAIPEVGTTTYRPPYVPVSFGAMTGHHRGQGFPPDPAAALASMGGRAGRGVRRVRRVAARAILSARRPRRTGSKPSIVK